MSFVAFFSLTIVSLPNHKHFTFQLILRPFSLIAKEALIQCHLEAVIPRYLITLHQTSNVVKICALGSSYIFQNVSESWLEDPGGTGGHIEALCPSRVSVVKFPFLSLFTSKIAPGL